MKRWIQTAVIVVTTVFLCRGGFAEGVFVAGRDIGERRDCNLRVTAGTVMEIEGAVQETTRAVYDVEGQSWKQDLAEKFDLGDFGMDEGYPTIGLSFENAGKYFTFQFELSAMNPKVETVALRNYYIGVGKKIEFGGREYENMKIPEGTPFSVDIISGVTELRGLITPFTIKPVEGFRFTPWVDLGLYLFIGQYEIDAGPVTGTYIYLREQEEFAVGGQSEGMIGVGMPELGAGGEIRIGGQDKVNLVLQGYYSVFEYEGGTGFLTSSKHREKDVDLEHVDYRVRCTLEIPMASGRCFTLGARYQLVETDASITSQEATDEEILARGERFDKDVNFKMASITGMIGFTF